jgi:hypothetical protein
MFTRSLSLLLSLGSFLVASTQVATAAPPTIELDVPKYNYPQAEATNGEGIANNGSIVGQYVFHGVVNGFLRLPHAPFSPPIFVPGSIETVARGVNNSGVVCGTFVTGGVMPRDHGFFFDGTTYTQYDVPGAEHTDVTGENDAGNFTGFYYDGVSWTGFVNIGGFLTTFEALGSNVTFAQAINNLGQIVGYVGDISFTGFFRDTDGTVASITYPGATSTFVYGLNDRGLMVGAWEDAGGDMHGFVRTTTGHFISYDYPDEQFRFTLFRGINNSGVINGFAQDPAGGPGTLFGFIARVVR